MCGIVGHVGRDLKKTHLTYLKHRGKDAQKKWSNNRNCSLGHVRLSILDLNERANQPMCDHNERYYIVFNGEIYNYLELKEKYLGDVSLVTSSDTEVLLHLWRRYQEKCLPFLRGMFAFAIWDEKKEKLWMARDRFGQKPLHYYQRRQGISFGSELNILRKDFDHSFEISDTGVAFFLKYQFIPAPYTIYREVKKLRPAHYLVWENGKLDINRYWDISFDEDFYSNLTEDKAIEKIESKITEAVKLRLRSDVPIGALLSGGVDSSLITSIAAQNSSGDFHTFSIGFANEKYNELEYAQKVAERYQTKHHEHILQEQDALNLLDKVVAQYGEPFGDKSALPSMLVSRIASNKLKVVLNGDGGDELLGGYGKYGINKLHQLFSGLNLQKYKWGKQLKLLKKGMDSDLLDYFLLRLNYSIMNPYSRVVDFPEFYNERYFERILKNKFDTASFREVEKEYLDAIFDTIDPTSNTFNQLLKIDYQHYFSNNLLVKMDIASMAYGLEARSPLMDHELMEEAARLPVHFKIHQGEGKYLLKRIAEKFLPSDLLYRKKMGFAIPVSEWMRGRFGDQLLELMNDDGNKAWQYINRDYLKTLYVEHGRKEKDHSGRLWLALILSKWFEWSQKF